MSKTYYLLFALFDHYMDQLELEPVVPVKKEGGDKVAEGSYLVNKPPPTAALSLPAVSSEEKDPVQQCLEKLMTLELKDVKCYDPNEQRKIMNVIRDVGIAKFEKCIHEMAENKLKQIEEEQRKEKRPSGRSSRSAVSSLCKLSEPGAVIFENPIVQKGLHMV